jgi:hypothetical protein
VYPARFAQDLRPTRCRDPARVGENTHASEKNHRLTKIPTPKIPIWPRMSKKHQKTPTTLATNKKDKKKVTKIPKITGLFSITDDENELLRVLAIESCVRVGVSRCLLKKNTNKVRNFFDEKW